LELHGSNWHQYCIDCGKSFLLDYILDPERNIDGVPRCENCRGIVRPKVVLYEEQLDPEVMQAAISAIAAAELLIVGGTSLSVYPAAGLVRYFGGENLVLINLSETPFDSLAQLVINESIGTVLDDALSLMLS
jgi:NAD-dependent deacetylase